MKILYEIGPNKIWIGSVNNRIEFRVGVPEEVPDDLGEQILKKKTIVFKKVQESGTKK